MLTPYRQCRVTFAPFADDFIARKGEDEVDREAVLRALRDFLKANNLKADWAGIENAPNEALVNALAMMSPYGPPEKQAMLEAPDLKTRAEILVALTEIELAKKQHRRRAEQAAIGTACYRRHGRISVARHESDNSATGRTASIRKLLEILVCPVTKGPLEYDAARQELISRRQARLSDPRRHSDHAGRRSAPARLILKRETTRKEHDDQDLGPQHVVQRAEGDVGGRRARPRA